MSAAPTTVRDVRHLGDFSATSRMLFIAALALPIGAGGAGAAWVLARLIGLITNAVFHQRISTALTSPGEHHAWWLVLSAPVVGGLLVGAMARYGSERIRGHGMPETIEAVLLGGSRVQPRVAVLKPISAAISIGTGGPFGAEGPIIMTGGALGSLLAQSLRLTADERKTLLVSGSAAGMAAIFNAPLASICLAAELLLFEWRPRSLVPVGAAVVVGTVLRHHLLGGGAIFPAHGALHLHDVDYALCVLSGAVSTLLALVATVLVYLSEDLFHRLPVPWPWWPGIGGLIIGLGGLAVPQALGVGYDVIDAELTGTIGLGLVIGILVVKTLIWSLSLGSGTSGGVLAPMFMIGGAIGALEAHVFPPVGPGFWAMVGLAGVLGGVMRSPLTGIVFSLELTGRWDAMLPLIAATTTAYGISVLVLKRSVLTEKIARRGYHLSREYDVDPLEIVFVSEVMDTDVVEFESHLSIAEAREALEASWRQRLYPVVDGSGAMQGVLTRGDLLGAGGSDGASVTDLMRTGPVLTHADQPLRVVAEEMAVEDVTAMPVVERTDPSRVVGVVTLTHLLAGRRRDQAEARDRRRLLRIRMVGAALRPAAPERTEATAGHGSVKE